MGSFSEVVFSVFLLLSTLYLITASDDVKYDDLDRGVRSDRDGVWFGPRLGKRSLQLNDEDKSDTILKLLEAADTLKGYYDEMPFLIQPDAPQKVTKKVIIKPEAEEEANKNKSGPKKYNNYEYTPRLGRRLREKMPPTPPEEDIVISYPMVMNPIIYPHSNDYTPRLGRSYKFSPQPGREVYDMYPKTKIRVARNVNNTITD